MNTLTAEPTLATRLNIGEVTDWRLHWLLCDLWNIQRDTLTTNFGQRVALLHEGPFAAMLERLKRVESNYQRLRWETKTMLGLDYEDDVEPLFASLPKNLDYAMELQKTKAQLQGIADKALENEALVVRNSIAA